MKLDLPSIKQRWGEHLGGRNRGGRGLEREGIPYYCGIVGQTTPTPRTPDTVVKNNANADKTATRKTGKKTAKKTALTFLTPARGGGHGADTGGRFNAKTRRLSLPTRYNGKRVAVVLDGKTLFVGTASDADANAFAVHPTQHFVTLPPATVAGWGTTTLAVADTPAPRGLTDAVAYTTPTPVKTAKKTA